MEMYLLKFSCEVQDQAGKVLDRKKFEVRCRGRRDLEQMVDDFMAKHSQRYPETSLVIREFPVAELIDFPNHWPLSNPASSYLKVLN